MIPGSFFDGMNPMSHVLMGISNSENICPDVESAVSECVRPFACSVINVQRGFSCSQIHPVHASKE
jgi:hypothetical protein